MTKAEQFVQQSNKENDVILDDKVDHRENIKNILHDSELNQFHWQGDPSIITFNDASKALWWSGDLQWFLADDDPEPVEPPKPSQTLAEQFAEKYNEINHCITTGRQINYLQNIVDGGSFFGPVENAYAGPVYRFPDGSKAWWGEGDLWRTSPDGSGPKVNPLRPTKPGCRCDLGLRCNGLAIYDDLVTVKSQRRRAQRDLNDKVEELFQARARILLLESEANNCSECMLTQRYASVKAQLTELRDEKKKWVSCEVGKSLVTRQWADQWADQRVEECKDSLSHRIDELEKRNKYLEYCRDEYLKTESYQIEKAVKAEQLWEKEVELRKFVEGQRDDIEAELSQARARILLLDAAVNEAQAELVGLTQRHTSVKAELTEYQKENKLVHNALAVANDTNASQLSTIKSYAEQIGYLQDQLALAKSAAQSSPTKGVLESLELVEGVEHAWLIKEASGNIVIGLAIDPGHHDDIQNFIDMYHGDIFPTDTNTEVKIFIELVSV